MTASACGSAPGGARTIRVESNALLSCHNLVAVRGYPGARLHLPPTLRFGDTRADRNLHMSDEGRLVYVGRFTHSIYWSRAADIEIRDRSLGPRVVSVEPQSLARVVPEAVWPRRGSVFLSSVAPGQMPVGAFALLTFGSLESLSISEVEVRIAHGVRDQSAEEAGFSEWEAIAQLTHMVDSKASRMSLIALALADVPLTCLLAADPISRFASGGQTCETAVTRSLRVEYVHCRDARGMTHSRMYAS